MAFCRKCGNKINGDIRFCSKCGSEIKKEIGIGNNQENLRQEVENETVRKKSEFKGGTLILEKEEIIEKSPKVEKIENPKVVKKSKKKGVIIGSIILVVIAIGGGLAYTFYDDILYKIYTKEIASSQDLSDKMENYEKIIKLGKYNEVKAEMQNLLKDNISNIKYIDDMKSLTTEKKNELKKAVLVNLAEKKYLNDEIVEAKELLDRAVLCGYSKDEVLYKNISEKIDGAYITDNTLEPEIESESESDMLFADSNTRYLTSDELRIYSKEELALARNEIYARHGYVFNQEPFKSYFNEKEWYVANSSFKGSDSELNSYEVANVKLLLDLEKER